jgi:hypothetical protein
MLKRKSFPGKIGRHAPRAPIHLYIWSEAAIKIMVESAGWIWISELSEVGKNIDFSHKMIFFTIINAKLILQ